MLVESKAKPIESDMSGGNFAVDAAGQELLQEVLIMSLNPLSSCLLTNEGTNEGRNRMKYLLWER